MTTAAQDEADDKAANNYIATRLRTQQITDRFTDVIEAMGDGDALIDQRDEAFALTHALMRIAASVIIVSSKGRYAPSPLAELAKNLLDVELSAMAAERLLQIEEEAP